MDDSVYTLDAVHGNRVSVARVTGAPGLFVAFVARLDGGVRGVFHSDGFTTLEIAREGDPGLADFC